MKVFTIKSGEVSEGATVGKFVLSGGATAPAILVGEEGRGRGLGAVPVFGTDGRVTCCDVGEMRSGRKKLTASENDDNDKCVIVFRTKIGYRGGNEHTGDRAGWECNFYDCPKPSGDGNRPTVCPECGRKSDIRIHFADFPGEIIAEGTIAQGAAGRAGSGQQIVAIMPKGIVFRTGYSGRLYGSPAAHYYVFDGEKITPATWEEREMLDLF